MPWIVAGNTVVYETTSNWRPYCGCDDHQPRIRRLSPGWAPSSAPTTVSRSEPRPVATRATVYPVSSFTYVNRSSTASSTCGAGRDETPAATTHILPCPDPSARAECRLPESVTGLHYLLRHGHGCGVRLSQLPGSSR